ncbi:hypothetical protein STSP2_02801 [Anaerohalosphaera lusitana]|uniref:Uncharacterized protein n=1 Tax=Anaerohalosphaera lusitana TaxID=1936003 RepID=A0A1U9NP81_9BACT|nr:hypothetical protein [Anaerohalosphaera lusitana]AQT69607.1 hypothetical protein STSP2_02801 [Anaerohalosphaera lusitana]
MQRYAQIAGWIAKDGLLKYKVRAAATVVAGTMSGMLQAAALGQAVYYAKLLERGNTVAFFGFYFDPRKSLVLITIASIGVLITLLVSSLLQFFSRYQAIRINTIYEEFCVKRGIKTAANFQVLHSTNVSCPPDEKIVRRICHSDCRLAGRALRLLLWAVGPFTQLVIFVSILFYLDQIATIFAGLAALATGYFLYRINQSATADSRIYEDSGPGAATEKAQLIHQACSITQFGHVPSWYEDVYSNGQIDVNRKAYEARLSVTERSRLVVGILSAIIIGVAIVYFGGKSIVAGTSWGALLAYIYMLKRSTQLTEQIAITITSVNRFYPQIKRYYEFITHSNTPPSSKQCLSGPDEVPTGKLGSEAVAGTESEYILKAGRPIALLSPYQINRYSLAHTIESLLSESYITSVLPSTCFISKNYSIPPFTLRNFLYLSDDVTRTELSDQLAAAGLKPESLQTLPQNIDSVIYPDQWQNLDPTLRYAIAMQAVCNSSYKWVLIDRIVVTTLPKATYDHYLNRLEKIFIIVVDSPKIDYKKIGSYNEERVIVLKNSAIAGIGSPEWALDNKEQIESVIGPQFAIEAAQIAEADISAMEE